MATEDHDLDHNFNFRTGRHMDKYDHKFVPDAYGVCRRCGEERHPSPGKSEPEEPSDFEGKEACTCLPLPEPPGDDCPAHGESSVCEAQTDGD